MCQQIISISSPNLLYVIPASFSNNPDSSPESPLPVLLSFSPAGYSLHNRDSRRSHWPAFLKATWFHVLFRLLSHFHFLAFLLQISFLFRKNNQQHETSCRYLYFKPTNNKTQWNIHYKFFFNFLFKIFQNSCFPCFSFIKGYETYPNGTLTSSYPALVVIEALETVSHFAYLQLNICIALPDTCSEGRT